MKKICGLLFFTLCGLLKGMEKSDDFIPLSVKELPKQNTYIHEIVAFIAAKKAKSQQARHEHFLRLTKTKLPEDLTFEQFRGVCNFIAYVLTDTPTQIERNFYTKLLECLKVSYYIDEILRLIKELSIYVPNDLDKVIQRGSQEYLRASKETLKDILPILEADLPDAQIGASYAARISELIEAVAAMKEPMTCYAFLANVPLDVEASEAAARSKEPIASGTFLGQIPVDVMTLEIFKLRLASLDTQSTLMNRNVAQAFQQLLLRFADQPDVTAELQALELHYSTQKSKTVSAPTLPEGRPLNYSSLSELFISGFSINDRAKDYNRIKDRLVTLVYSNPTYLQHTRRSQLVFLGAANGDMRIVSDFLMDIPTVEYDFSLLMAIVSGQEHVAEAILALRPRLVGDEERLPFDHILLYVATGTRNKNLMRAIVKSFSLPPQPIDRLSMIQAAILQLFALSGVREDFELSCDTLIESKDLTSEQKNFMLDCWDGELEKVKSTKNNHRELGLILAIIAVCRKNKELAQELEDTPSPTVLDTLRHIARQVHAEEILHYFEPKKR